MFDGMFDYCSLYTGASLGTCGPPWQRLPLRVGTPRDAPHRAYQQLL